MRVCSQAPRRNSRAVRWRVRVKESYSGRQASPTRGDQLGLVASEGLNQEAQSLEHRMVAESLSVLHEPESVVVVELGFENLSCVSNASAYARCVKDVYDRSRGVGDLEAYLFMPYGFEPPRHGALTGVCEEIVGTEQACLRGTDALSGL